MMADVGGGGRAAGEVRISAGVEAALAPALLPRTWLTLRLLQELRAVSCRCPSPPVALRLPARPLLRSYMPSPPPAYGLSLNS